MFNRVMVGAVLASLGLFTGCASTPDTQTASAPAGVTYRDHKDLQKVWLAPGFDFRGYDTLFIVETGKDVPKIHPDGVESLEWSRGVVQSELATAIEAKKFFPRVVTRASDIPPGSKMLKLENTIIEYEKGGGAARWFAGLYGAGQPVIKVRGRVADGDRPLFMFEARRSGESGSARWLGGYRDDRDIQQEDIRDLGVDLADFIVQTAQGQKK